MMRYVATMTMITAVKNHNIAEIGSLTEMASQ